MGMGTEAMGTETMTQTRLFRKDVPWRRVRAMVTAVVALGTLAGCTTSSGTTAATEHDEPVANDPLEGVNRTIFGLNELLDLLFIGPAAQVYSDVVPPPVRGSIRGVLNNLAAPVVAANQVLQGDLDGALTTAQRFVINTTIGVGGIADIAAMNGLKHRNEDFGQTLGVWGFGEGPYLVLPLLGPSNLRDALGLGVDTLADPMRIYTQARDLNNLDDLYIARNGVRIIDRRTDFLEVINDLRRNSIDYYASMRSVYRQRRQNEIADAGKAAVTPAKETPVPAAASSGAGAQTAPTPAHLKATPPVLKAPAAIGGAKKSLRKHKYQSHKARYGKSQRMPKRH